MASPEGDFAHEVAAIRDEYERRELAPQCIGEYSFLNPVHAALVLDREIALLRALAAHLHVPLDHAEILDVGCGTGESLALLASYGAEPRRLHGVDILEHRIERARQRFPLFDLRVGDGSTLPYPDSSFDLVQQVTMLSSVHEAALRRRLAAEMVRVLRPSGIVLSYDGSPVGFAPRALNRALGLLHDRRPDAAAVASPERVALRPIHALQAPEVKVLFGALAPLLLERMTPYRPLAERVAGSRLLFGGLAALRPLSSAVLYLGRKSP